MTAVEQIGRDAARIMQARSMDGPSFTKSKLDGAELIDRFEKGASALVDTLASTPADDAANVEVVGDPAPVRAFLGLG